MQALAIGHVLVDTRCYVKNFPHEDKTSFTTADIATSLGGSAANTAVVANKLGCKTGLIAAVADDYEGRYLLMELKRLKVDSDGVRVVKGKTGRAIVVINKKGKVEVVEMRGVADQIGKISPDDLEGAKHLHMTGTKISVLEQASAAAKKHGLSISFDPGRSISRQGLFKMKKILKNTDYLVSNRKETLEMSREKNLEKALGKILSKHPTTLIIKGAEKKILVRGKENFDVNTYRVKAVDNIGAGDAFAGGLITQLSKNKSLEKAVSFAAATGAAEVLKKGAHTLCGKKDILNIMRGKKTC